MNPVDYKRTINAQTAEIKRLREALIQIEVGPLLITTDLEKWADWAVETARAALKDSTQ
jgi:hypothetical protein